MPRDSSFEDSAVLEEAFVTWTARTFVVPHKQVAGGRYFRN